MRRCPVCNEKVSNKSQVDDHLKRHPGAVDADQLWVEVISARAHLKLSRVLSLYSYHHCSVDGCQYKTLQHANLRNSHTNQQ